MRMRTALEERAWYQLAVHFFRRLFDFGILSDAGSDAFRRILMAIIAMMLSVGLLITRMYLSKYSALSEKYHDWGSGYQLNREPYRLATLGDGALMLAFPMLIVAFVGVLVSTSLFPDHLDYRVLRPLPVSTRVVFASKALAFAFFTGIFAVPATLAMMPLVLLMWNSRWAEDRLVTRLVAYGIASISASVVTALVITGATGVLLMCVPRPRQQLVLAACRGLGLFGLVLLVPLACRLPTIGERIVSESAWLYLVPPVWFVGVEQLTLGYATPFFLQLTQIAVIVASLSVAVAGGSYLYLYKRFERVLSPPAMTGRASSGRPRFGRARGARAAVPLFIKTTLARSPLHQGVVVTIAACGAAVVLNSILQHFESTATLRAGDSLRATAIWAPFALVFAANLALRAALAIPIELRANWIFRLTEGAPTRAEEIAAVARTLIAGGIILPLAILFPLTWAVLGWLAIPCTAVAWLGGVLLVELQMMEWRRVPFTCSYEPSTQVAGKTLLVGIVAFALFTTSGPRLVLYSSSHPVGWVTVMVMLAAVVLYLRRQRLFFSRHATLMFEDVLPNDVEPLRLSEY